MASISATAVTLDPDALFLGWLRLNRNRLGDALSELGAIAQEGPDFFDRLRDAVTVILVEKATHAVRDTTVRQ